MLAIRLPDESPCVSATSATIRQALHDAISAADAIAAECNHISFLYLDRLPELGLRRFHPQVPAGFAGCSLCECNSISMSLRMTSRGIAACRNGTDAAEISVRQRVLASSAQCVIGFFDPESLHLSLESGPLEAQHLGCSATSREPAVGRS